VLGLVVAAYMLTYMDRVNLASAIPVIQHDLGFSMVTIGWIFAAFAMRQYRARVPYWV